MSKRYYPRTTEKAILAHRAHNKRHVVMMTGLGYKGGLRSHAAYLTKLKVASAWNKAHKDRVAASCRRYRARLTAKYGSAGRWGVYLGKSDRAAARLAKQREAMNEARTALFQLQSVCASYRGRRPLSMDGR